MATNHRNNRNSPPPSSEESPVAKIFNVLFLVLEIVFLHIRVYYYVAENFIMKFFPKEEEDVRGKVVLITGAAHGMGKELALQYGQLGAKLVCWDINERGNADLAKEVKSKNGKITTYVCDVTSREAIMATAEKVKKEVGTVDILINNAGIMPTHSLLDHTEKELRMLYDINVLAHFYLIQAFLPDMMKQKKGHLVALSSCAGLFGLKNLVPYCGTKFAVRGIMMSLQEELRKVCPEIKFTTIYPYMVDTGLCKKPVMRFQNQMKMVNPTEAASAIIKAQRTGVEHTTIPKHFLYMEMIMKFFPKKALNALNDFMDVSLDSDLH